MLPDEDHADDGAWLQVLSELVIPAEQGEKPDSGGIADYLCALRETPRGQLLNLLLRELRSGLSEIGEPDFLNLSRAEKQARLEQVVKQTTGPVGQAWSMFIEFCIEAWLCDPARGGNRGGHGWRRVGMTGPRPPTSA